MKKVKFKLWHSLFGIAIILLIEIVVYFIFPEGAIPLASVYVASILGSLITIYVATEVIEEVRGSSHMFVLLTVIIAQFIALFAFEYWFIIAIDPATFPTFSTEPLDLFLQSIMVFVFNPIYVPATASGRALIIIDTFGSLGLALFVLQNIGQLRNKSLDSEARKTKRLKSKISKE